MKKILILFLIFISVKSFGQSGYPVSQTLGGDSTLITVKGAEKARVIVWAYTDTAAANLQRIKQYPYALIATDDHNLWIRNIDATVWVLQGTSSGTSGVDTVFLADDLVNRPRTASGKQVIGRLHDDGYTGGKVTWTGTGLNFVVAPSILYLGGRTYTFPSTPLTLTPADLTYSRYDVFGIDSLGPFVLTGIPDPTPLVPQVDAGQFALTSGTLINVGDTVPASVTIEMIYNENLGYPSEWLAQTQGNPSTVNYNSLTNPFLGVKAGYVSSYTNGAQLRFVDYSGVYIRHTVNPLDVLVFALYSNGRFNNQIYAKFYDSALTATTNLLISTSQFGFNPNDSNRYQIITIPLSAFNWQRQTYSTLSLQLSGNDTSGAKGFYIDWVNIQSNLNNTPPPTDYSLKQDSNTLVKTIVGSDTLNTVYWWSKGVSHALAPIYTGGAAGSSGTVTSISQGYGITNTPNPITTTGTVAADSATLSNYYLRRKDSVLYTTIYQNSLKLNISDTSSMLSPYLRKVDTTNKWVNDVTYVNDSTLRVWKGSGSSTVRTGPGTSGGGGSSQWITTGSDIYYNVGGAGVGNTSVAPSSIFDLTSTTKGFLPPRMTTTQRNAISSPATGLHIYSLTDSLDEYYNGTQWVTPLKFNFVSLANQDLLRYNSSGGYWENFSSGSLTGWSITGNTGLTPTVNFLGTIDYVPLEFRVRNLRSGYIDSFNTTTGKTIFGYKAGFANTTADITAIGYKALVSSTGALNTAVGNQALFTATTATHNTAVGYNALLTSNGNDNTAVGYLALSTAAAATGNTAVGQGAGKNTTASSTTFVGSEAGEIGVGGLANTGFGRYTLRNSTGTENTAIGFGAMINASSGSLNTALGSNAMGAAVMSGSNNTAIGYEALGNQTSGASNIALGYRAGKYNTTVSNQLFISSTDHATLQALQNRGIIFGVQATVSQGVETSQKLTLNGKVGINTVAPTAYTHLTRGTTVATTAPLKFTGPISLTTTAAAGTGATATLTFATTTNPPFVTGSTIVVAGVTPAGYNGTYVVTGVTETTVSYASATTGAQTVAGTIAQGALLTTPENQAVENDTTNLYWSSGTNANLRRYYLDKSLTATATLNFDLTAVNSQDLTITVTGAAAGDAVSLALDPASVPADITYFGWVSAANTVTVRCSRVGGGGAVDPASGTFRAVVTKY